MKKHNFSAGPCVLPKEVFQKSSDAILNFNKLNLSIIEISHRSKDFVAVMNKTINLVKELLNVPNGYSVLFLQGGASLQFCMIPYNFLTKKGKATYVETGTWAKKAAKEAKLFGNTEIVASSANNNFNYIPKNYIVDENSDYLHLTSNNTIVGTQIKKFPSIKIPIICDMSSDIFSKKIDVSKFGLIYAGAQKNMGPAGATLIIIRDDLLGHVDREIPTMLNYQTHIDKESMFNTPPVFSIYASMLTLEWLKKNGGVDWIEKVNNKKASMMYQEIDRNALFCGTAKTEDRSTMNATFLLTQASLKSEFELACKNEGINGINGHRSVGGYRASMYNALSKESVEKLIEIMQKLEKKYT